MIYYPVETLVESGIIEILVITTAEHQPLFKKALGDGSQFGAHFEYAIQEEANGIARAISIGQEFIGKDGVCLITGDMIIAGERMKDHIQKAIRTVSKSGNATIFVENKTYPDQYGMVIVDREQKVLDIVGTNDARHYYSITSFYVFPNSVIKHVSNIGLSERGRLEITDVNKRFFEECKLQVRMLESSIIWFDTNTIDNIQKCSDYFRRNNKR